MTLSAMEVASRSMSSGAGAATARLRTRASAATENFILTSGFFGGWVGFVLSC